MTNKRYPDPSRSDMTHAGMLALLNGKDSRTVGNNTTLHLSYGGSVAIRLHNTDVVTYHPDGRIILSTGGWNTNTTKDRLRKWAPVQVGTRKGILYVNAISAIRGYYDPDYINPEKGWAGEWISFATGLPLDSGEFYDRSPSVEFFDGIDVSGMVAQVA